MKRAIIAIIIALSIIVIAACILKKDIEHSMIGTSSRTSHPVLNKLREWLVNNSLAFQNRNLTLKAWENATKLEIPQKCIVSLSSNITEAKIIVNNSEIAIPYKMHVLCGSLLNLTPIPVRDYLPVNSSKEIHVDRNLSIFFAFFKKKIEKPLIEHVNKPICEEYICTVKYPPIFATSVIKENGLEKYVVSVDMWNLKSVDGKIEVKCLENKTLIIVDVEKAKAIDPEKEVVGYPEIWIGCKPWGNPCAYSFWNLSFPTKNYDLNISIAFTFMNGEGTVNVAFDMWFVPTAKKTVDPTLDSKTVELMIWLFYDKYLISWMHMKWKNLKFPVIIDGKEILLDFRVFHCRMPWHYIAVFPKDPDCLNGKWIIINLNKLIDDVNILYPEAQVRDKWLFGIELGTEFIEGDSNFILEIRKFAVYKS